MEYCFLALISCRVIVAGFLAGPALAFGSGL